MKNCNYDLLYALFNIKKEIFKINNNYFNNQENPFDLMLSLLNVDRDFDKNNFLDNNLNLTESLYIIWNESRQYSPLGNLDSSEEDIELKILEYLDLITIYLNLDYREINNFITKKEARY